MASNKGNHSSSGGNRGRPYALMLLLAFGAALLGVMLLHKLRERRIYNLLVKEKDRDLLALHLLLQKERDHTEEMRRKNEEMKAKIYSLRSQKMELDRRVLEMKSTMDLLREEQKVMESAFEEKQNEIKMLQEKESNLGKENSQLIALKEELKRKEAEIEELKNRFQVPFNKSRWVSSNDSTNLPESVSANGKMAVQDHKTQIENKERDDEKSHESTKYGDGKGIANEDASKTKLTKFKDGDVTLKVENEIPDEKGDNDRHMKRQETLQVDQGVSGGGTAGEKITDGELGNISEDSEDDGTAGVTSKEIEVKIVDGRENATIRGEQRGQFENNTAGGVQDFNLKQLADSSKIPSDVKRKHVRVSRTKGKRRRTIVKNRLLGNNGVSESHGAVNMTSRKGNRYEKDELKDRTEGRVSNDENIQREEEEMDNNNPGKDKAEAKLAKSGNHGDIQDDAKMEIVNDANHQVSDNGIGMHPRKLSLDEVRQSEKQEDSGVEQSWSRRHINIVEKHAGHETTGMFHEELKATNVQEQEKDTTDRSDEEDNDDNFYKESQSDFADEKDEYKEEVDESEFQTGLLKKM